MRKVSQANRISISPNSLIPESYPLPKSNVRLYRLADKQRPEHAFDPFAACWDTPEDPRTGNAALHDFHELPMIALCTVLAAAGVPSAWQSSHARKKPSCVACSSSKTACPATSNHGNRFRAGERQARTGQGRIGRDPRAGVISSRRTHPPPAAATARLSSLGPAGFAAAARRRSAPLGRAPSPGQARSLSPAPLW